MATTVREFDGDGDLVEFAPGVLEVVGGAVPVTVMALVRFGVGESFWQTVVSFEAPGADERVGLQVNTDADVLGLVAPFGFDLISAVVSAPAGQWLVVGMHRPAGANQRIRLHVCDVATGAWVHEDTATRSDPGAIGSSGRIQVGEMSTFGEFLAGRLAVIGVWLDIMSDQDIEAAGLHTALVNWLGLGSGPASLLVFNQESTSTAVTDVVAGSGVTQTSIVGTTVVDDQDLTFDYSLGGSGTREARSWAAPAASQADRVGSGTREARSWTAPAASQADRVGSGTREARSWSAPAASQAEVITRSVRDVRSWAAPAASQADRAGSGTREARSWAAPAASQADRAGSGTREARSWSAPAASQADRAGSGTREARSWSAPAASQAEVIIRSVRDVRSWSAPAASQADRAGSGTREARSWAAPAASQADRAGSGTREARSWAAPAASWAEAIESEEPDRSITPFPFPPRPVTPSPFELQPVTSPPFELQPVRSFREVGRGCP